MYPGLHLDNGFHFEALIKAKLGYKLQKAAHAMKCQLTVNSTIISPVRKFNNPVLSVQVVMLKWAHNVLYIPHRVFGVSVYTNLTCPSLPGKLTKVSSYQWVAHDVKLMQLNEKQKTSYRNSYGQKQFALFLSHPQAVKQNTSKNKTFSV